MNNTKSIQVVNFHEGPFEYQNLENLIFDKTRVKCTVVCKPGCISIRTKSLADYYLARAEIKSRVGSRMVLRDFQELEG